MATVTTTAINQNNVVVPPTTLTPYYFPSALGVSVPLGAKSLALIYDTTGLTGGKILDAWIEYKRGLVWQRWVGGDLRVGPYRNGTFVGGLSADLDALDGNGSFINPYPEMVRVVFTNCPGKTIPNIKLVFYN